MCRYSCLKSVNRLDKKLSIFFLSLPCLQVKRGTSQHGSKVAARGEKHKKRKVFSLE